jgi:hypothetical protein
MHFHKEICTGALGFSAALPDYTPVGQKRNQAKFQNVADLKNSINFKITTERSSIKASIAEPSISHAMIEMTN